MIKKSIYSPSVTRVGARSKGPSCRSFSSTTYLLLDYKFAVSCNKSTEDDPGGHSIGPIYSAGTHAARYLNQIVIKQI